MSLMALADHAFGQKVPAAGSRIIHSTSAWLEGRGGATANLPPELGPVLAQLSSLILRHLKEPADALRLAHVALPEVQ